MMYLQELENHLHHLRMKHGDIEVGIDTDGVNIHPIDAIGTPTNEEGKAMVVLSTFEQSVPDASGYSL